MALSGLRGAKLLYVASLSLPSDAVSQKKEGGGGTLHAQILLWSSPTVHSFMVVFVEYCVSLQLEPHAAWCELSHLITTFSKWHFCFCCLPVLVVRGRGPSWKHFQ